MPTADLYLPPGHDIWQWHHAAYALAEAEGWPVRGIITRWPEVASVLAPPCANCGWSSGVDIVIVPLRSMLPAGRLPRLVVVAEQPQPTRLIPPQRRPRRLRE